MAVDNRWDRALAVDVSTVDGVAGVLDVGACEAAQMTVEADPPFGVGWGPSGDRGGRPMPRVIESDDLTPIEGGYRVLVRVAQDGSVTADNLVGPSPRRPAGQC